jgi:hypothetical protein
MARVNAWVGLMLRLRFQKQLILQGQWMSKPRHICASFAQKRRTDELRATERRKNTIKAPHKTRGRRACFGCVTPPSV